MAKTAKKASQINGSLAKVIADAQALKKEIAALGLPGLTAEERLHSNGRLRENEPAAMTSVFDTVDAFPAIFQSLVGDDGDVTDATTTARASLATATALAPLGALLDAMQSQVSDGILANASQAKDVSLPAYTIGKANAESNAKVRKVLSAAIDFYGAPGRKRAERKTREANAAKKKKKTPATST